MYKFERLEIKSPLTREHGMIDHAQITAPTFSWMGDDVVVHTNVRTVICHIVIMEGDSEFDFDDEMNRSNVIYVLNRPGWWSELRRRIRWHLTSCFNTNSTHQFNQMYYRYQQDIEEMTYESILQQTFPILVRD